MENKLTELIKYLWALLMFAIGSVCGLGGFAIVFLTGIPENNIELGISLGSGILMAVGFLLAHFSFFYSKN
jgi:hypothetical protein